MSALEHPCPECGKGCVTCFNAGKMSLRRVWRNQTETTMGELETEFVVCECGHDRFYTATVIRTKGGEVRWEDVDVCESCGGVVTNPAAAVSSGRQQTEEGAE